MSDSRDSIKEAVYHDEKGNAAALEAGGIDLQHNIDYGFDPSFVKKTMRKVDLRLIPVLSAMYCISLIDRTNLSVARQANHLAMNKKLGLSIGQRYTIATLIFFIPYIILEIPFGLRKFGARIWLGSAVVLWGVAMIGMGFVTNWNGLAGTRALLGVFEAVLFPGAAYLIACWYPRKSMATRNTAFYVISIVISGLSSILGYGLSQLHGRNGLQGWQWLFIVEGLMTVGVGIMGLLLIVDFPDRAKFLTAEQRKLVATRIDRDRGDAVHDPLTLAKVGKYLLSGRIWLYGFMFGSSTLGSYSLAYFLPAILEGMGFSNAKAQLLVAPPYVWAAIPALTCAYIADRVPNARFAVIVFNATCLIVGTAMYSQIDKTKLAARYAGIFLAIGGCNSNVPLVLSWAQSTIRSQSKRAYTSALVVAWGGIGGILAAVAFQSKEATLPKPYRSGVNLTFGMNAATVAIACGLAVYYKWMNKKADRGEVVLEDDPTFRYQI